MRSRSKSVEMEINLEEIDNFLDNNHEFVQVPLKRSKIKFQHGNSNLEKLNDFPEKNKS
jgi:hypothetical protein